MLHPLVARPTPNTATLQQDPFYEEDEEDATKKKLRRVILHSRKPTMQTHHYTHLPAAYTHTPFRTRWHPVTAAACCSGVGGDRGRPRRY